MQTETSTKIEYNKDGYFIKDLMKRIIYTDGYSHNEFQVYAKDKVTVDDLTELYKNELILGHEVNFIKYDQLKDCSIKTFGKNIYSTPPKQFQAFCSKYILSEKGDFYTKEEIGCGGIGYRYDYNKITKVESDDNHIYVYQRAGFQGEDGINKNITTINENGNIRYVAKDLVKKVEFTDNVNLDEILDRLNEYKFTFTYDKTNNTYYFESVEKNN